MKKKQFLLSLVLLVMSFYLFNLLPVYADEWYTVRLGDTLLGISQKFRVPLEILVEVNKIENPNLVFAGQRILIPGPEEPLPRYSSSSPRLKTAEELKVEAAIEQTFESYFREISISGKTLLIRIPFGLEKERFPGQRFFRGGKGTPQELWPKIIEELGSEEFKEYIRLLSQPGKKLVLLNLPEKSVQVIFDPKTIEKLSFRRNKVYPTELKENAGFSEIDIYNYLYAKGIGIDCSAFSFNVLRSLGLQQYGLDLVKLTRTTDPIYIGTWIYNYWNIDEVNDRIINLRPGDVIQFHCWDQAFCHSAVIGKIDFTRGEITYYQCTDWVADRKERGPHESEIYFDPAFPERRLSDPRVIWEQRLGETFQGEGCPYQGRTDGYRYAIRGGGRVVRFKILTNLIRKREPKFY